MNPIDAIIIPIAALLISAVLVRIATAQARAERKAARRAAALRDRREAEYLAIRQARLRDHNLEWLDQHS